MTRLFVSLLLASMAVSTISTSGEAKGRVWRSPGGHPGWVSTPKKRCTKKRPCSRMPEIPYLPGEVIPMPRGGYPRDYINYIK